MILPLLVLVAGLALLSSPGKAHARTQTPPVKGKVMFSYAAGVKATTDAVIAILTDACMSCGIVSATITSTERTPADQARVMYNNCAGTGAKQGVANELKLYAAPGQAVIRVYSAQLSAGASPAAIQAAMLAEIIALGPSTVSHHCSDPSKLRVVDLGPSSLKNASGGIVPYAALVTALTNHAGVSKVLGPANSDPGVHVEIPVV